MTDTGTETDTDTLPLLVAFYREKLAALLSHEAGAKLIPQYDANNTYQYIVNREETQIAWLAGAIMDLGGSVPPDPPAPVRTGTAQTVFEEDARAAADFVERWKPQVAAMRHARHRRMLNVILGETLEQQRFFEQALAGRVDLLGTRTEKAGARVGTVLPSRWLE